MILKRKTIRNWFILVILAFSSLMYAQKPTLRFQHFTAEDGLAQSSVFCILQDQKGFMWFGTEQGLNRFDGYKFIVHRFQYNDPDSLNNSYILSCFEDSSGVLWVGTNGGGLNKLEPDSVRFTGYLIDPESLSSLANIINVILEDRFGILWIGTAGGGLKQFDRKTGTFIDFPITKEGPEPPGIDTIIALREARDGSIWIGTGGGLLRWDREKNETAPIPLPVKQIRSLYWDRMGRAWVGTDIGVYEYEPGTRNSTHYRIPADEENLYRANTINTFYEDRYGTFWIGTEYGVYIFDRLAGTYYRYFADRNDPYSLSSNRVTAIYEDRSGALWVGAQSGGLNKLNRSRQSFEHYYINPEHNRGLANWGIFAFYEDRQGLLWIGTNGEGLFSLNRENNEFKNYRNHSETPNSLSNNTIWALCEDRQGLLWIGTAGGGLNRFSRDTGTFTHYLHQPQNPNSLCSDTISTIIEDRNGTLWIGTNGGLNRFDPRENEFVHYRANPDIPDTLAHNLVYVIYEDRRGKFWIGTRRGACVFDPDRETFTTNRLNPRGTVGLPYSVFSICEDKNGFIWLGTTGGLNKIDPEKGIAAVYLEKDGLANDVINGILEDEFGNLWLSTNNGLSKFDPRTGKFQNYSVADGLQSYEFNGGAYFKSRGGELFFGGIDGFNAFFPRSVKDNPYIPPVLITDFQIFNQPVPVGKEFKGGMILKKSITAADSITLTHKHYTFSLEFAALSYIHSEENEYAYTMEGLEDTWNYVGQRRFVTYANLAPGEYTFRVKASNNNGVWNEKGAALKIRILPPLWETWWFRGVLGILILGLILAAFRLRTRLIMKRLLLEERMKMAGLEATRILAGGIAHDFNNLLATIIGNIDMAISESTPGDMIHKMLSSAELSSRKAADLVQQFLTFSKGGILIKKTVRLQGIVRDAVQAVLGNSNIKCGFYLYDSLWPVDCDPLQISQAVKNIVLNSKQAMAEDGILEVSAMNKESAADRIPGGPTGKCVCIFIKDNGIGIPKRNLSRIFEPYFTTGGDVTQKGLGLGLSIVHAIITRHGGSIQVTSEVGEGTTVRICLPASTEK